jgi:hypothetical protein
MPQQELDHQLLLLIYAEILHLKKLLITKGVIDKSSDDEYLNALDGYLTELDAKNFEIAKVVRERSNR